MLPRHFVVVGNSIAGIEAAILLRTRDATARITVISAESDYPFARTALMYVFCGQLRMEDTEFHDRGLYERMGFKRIGARVVALDAESHMLTLDTGATLTYERLLLAVGSKARRLPYPTAYDSPNVHHFVSMLDFQALNAAARPGMRAAVIGGGLIGVEVAEVLHHRGLSVTWIVRDAWVGPVALDRREATLVEDHVRRPGVDVRAGAGVRTLAPAKAFPGFTLDVDGKELGVDLVVGATGVVPNTAFLEGSGVALAADGSVETGDDLQSISAPDVFAAGDCACVTWADGSRGPETLWYTARDQGRAAAAAMLGDPTKYRRGTWTNSAKFFDIEYTTAGFVPVAQQSGRQHPGGGRWQTWFQKHPSEAASLRIAIKDSRVVGFNALGRRWSTEVWLRWVQERRPLEFVLAHLRESTFDEELTNPFPVLPTATLEEGA